MRCVSVLTVLELNEEERSAGGDTQPKGDLNCEDQTQMTSFEMNLKDKRFAENPPGAFRSARAGKAPAFMCLINIYADCL